MSEQWRMPYSERCWNIELGQRDLYWQDADVTPHRRAHLISCVVLNADVALHTHTQTHS